MPALAESLCIRLAPPIIMQRGLEACLMTLHLPLVQVMALKLHRLGRTSFRCRCVSSDPMLHDQLEFGEAAADVCLP